MPLFRPCAAAADAHLDPMWGGRQFVRSFPSLLAITPRRIRADAAVKAAEISTRRYHPPLASLIPKGRATIVLSLHRCAWTSLSLIPVAVAPLLLPEQFDFDFAH